MSPTRVQRPQRRRRARRAVAGVASCTLAIAGGCIGTAVDVPDQPDSGADAATRPADVAHVDQDQTVGDESIDSDTAEEGFDSAPDAVPEASVDANDASDAADAGPCNPCASTCCAGSCVLGRCLVTLASKQSLPYGLSVTSAGVFWTDPSANTLSVVTGGGPPVILAQGLDNPVGIVVRGPVVYFTNDDMAGANGSIARVPTSGGAVTTIASQVFSPWDLACDGTNFYWTTATTPGAVVQMPIGGGAQTTLASGEANTLGIAIDTKNVYWASAGSGTVKGVPIGGGTALTLASGQTAPYFVAADGTNVYFSSGSANGSVTQVSVASPGSPTSLAANQGTTTGVAVDATHVYWATVPGNIMRTPIGGGVIETLATGQAYATRIVVDDTSVYWTTHATGTVMKLTPK